MRQLCQGHDTIISVKAYVDSWSASWTTLPVGLSLTFGASSFQLLRPPFGLARLRETEDTFDNQ